MIGGGLAVDVGPGVLVVGNLVQDLLQIWLDGGYVHMHLHTQHVSSMTLPCFIFLPTLYVLKAQQFLHSRIK